jgi:DNA-binding NarL/FixJ family response regulator
VYGPEGPRRESLAKLVGRSGRTELREATASLERLYELAGAADVDAPAARNGRPLVLAHLGAGEELGEVMGPLSRLLAHARGSPLVVLTPHARRHAPRMLQAGARAVLASDADEELIVAALTCAQSGLAVMPAAAPGEPGVPAGLMAPPEPLTPRELEILGLLAAGDSNKTIAARLSISVHTVKYHISSILAKLGVVSRTEAVALGLKLGIVLL